jgi:hypothetical protein
MTSFASARAVARIAGMNGNEVSHFNLLTASMPSILGISVEQHQVWQQLAHFFERLHSVAGRHYLIALAFEAHLQDVEIVRNIIEDKNAGRVAHRRSSCVGQEFTNFR